MVRKAVLLMTLLALGACGGSSETSPPRAAAATRAATEAQTEEAAIERYCEAVTAANKQGEKIFADVDQEDEKALLEAEREVLEFVATTFPRGDDLPEEIEDDFETFLAGFEYRVETGAPEAKKHHQAAEKRLLEWEEEHCKK